LYFTSKNIFLEKRWYIYARSRIFYDPC
jgi:hypothetical protein